jgi:hypothetical protein
MSTNGSSKQLISEKNMITIKYIFMASEKKTMLKLSPMKQLISQGDLDVQCVNHL